MVRSDYIQAEWGALVGRSITKVRPLTKKEIKMIGWEGMDWNPAVCFELDDGTKLYPSADPELNSPGYLLVQ